jgi:predicted AlkP superfamily pyrophosphatase or phosphodiesterase
MAAPRPLVWLDVVGLTARLLRSGRCPALAALASRGGARALAGVVPAVTCTAQATMLTGEPPARHGIVGNGWFHRETGEVRFWVQANALLEAEPVYAALRRRARARGAPFTCAKIFWWFNQGADVDLAVTPKPFYGSDGSKAFAVHGRPEGFAAGLERDLGRFPFPAFWGPRAGIASSDWIADSAARVLRAHRPTLTLVYLPHLDYDGQRRAPDASDPVFAAALEAVDRAAGRVLDAAGEVGAEVVVVSEYGLAPVSRPVLPNRALREAGFLAVRDGPFGEGLEVFESRAFAVVDHQVAHVHVRDEADRAAVADLLAGLPGVGRVLAGPERGEVGLDHPRAGDLVLLAERDAWFAYPYWLDDRRAPDFARTVDIHRKPGYDPAELFLDPALKAPRLRLARRLLQKRLGFRYRMDVVPLDPSLVRGSHGLPPAHPDDGPVLVAEDPAALDAVASLEDLAPWTLTRLVP